MPRPRRRRAVAAAALATLVAAPVVACSGCSSTSHPSARPSNPTAVTVTVASSTTTEPPTTAGALPPVPPVGWLACDSGWQCGYVDVPLDYSHPGGRTIPIALERRPAADPAARIGALVINPGGPGDSGIDDLPTEVRVLTGDLLARFDIVSFDPRGVGRSAPVRCSAAEGPTAAGEPPGPLPDPVPQTEAARQSLLDADRGYARACQEHSGDLLPFVGTVDAARDLDRIRMALEEPRLTFLGHSYGTLLGSVYAELFPTRVRAMVLDGAIDPALSLDEMSLDQAVGFDATLQAFFHWCAGTGACAWRPPADPLQAFQDLLASTRTHRLDAAGGRSVGPGEFYLGTLSTLYARSFWPSLGRALAAAAQGNGSPLLALSDAYQQHGSTNASDANTAITCLDHPAPTDPTTYPAMAAAAGGQAPVFGPLFAWGALQCGTWPVAPTGHPRAIRAAGAPPILVVGTTGDPATPYAWAVALAGELQRGVLVGRQGIDHVAYYYSSCVRSIDARYLIDGTLPANGTLCAS